MKTTNRTKKIFAVFCAIVLMLCMATPAFADTNDPIAVVNNLSEFIFGLIRAVGIILLAFGMRVPEQYNHEPGLLPAPVVFGFSRFFRRIMYYFPVQTAKFFVGFLSQHGRV